MSADDAEEARLRVAREVAFEEGRHRERIEGRINSHEARLNAINGSIDRGTKATAELKRSIAEVHEAVGKIVAAQTTRDKIEEARAEELHVANEKQISTRMFVVGVATLAVMLLGVILSNAHLLGG